MKTHRYFRFAASVAALALAAACNNGTTSPSTSTPPALFSRQAKGDDGGNGSSGAAAGFAILANAAVTCTNGTITGDVGTFQATPTGSVTRTSCPITGTVHVGDEVAKQAYNAFLAKYDAVATAACDAVLTGTLAGRNLAPGVYCFDAAATLTGVLTLTGPSNASWTFKIGTLGTGALTGTNFSVVMAGGAQACNVSWWVSQAATLTDSDLKGSILAGAAITLTRGTFNGNAWSKADVTVTGTAVTGCASSGGGGGHGDGDDDDKGHKHKDKDKDKCNQGVGNGAEGCDPGNSNHRHGSNDENGGTPGNPGRRDH